jgi:hypothetical protein
MQAPTLKRLRMPPNKAMHLSGRIRGMRVSMAVGRAIWRQ